jgi:hypothetical protein
MTFIGKLKHATDQNNMVAAVVLMLNIALKAAAVMGQQRYT